ncbi:hypothetical protein NJC38_17120 [Pseudomonas sp. 21LCFQ010]|uniref:hypothetical protein n=1 Tax=Pseudomonas sp. 21LCFQ010 TaxID=2957506 RepID=UPI0020976227|nr:hypothetical protein [Pseudomonas sp. 21LCFQ010]MCO8163877.1 hypothetical protein [Pseudomonas sp. 21LCFQ010]
MDISQNSLYELFERSLRAFLRKDASLIYSNVSERNLCARLGYQFEHLLTEFKLVDYYTDPEHNRKQNGEIKTVISGEFQVIKVTCDLILHSRGEQIPDNLIAIEMAKPDKSAQEILSDRNRLIALTKQSFKEVWSNDGKTLPKHVCGYLLGAFIMVDRLNRVISVEFFEDGKSLGEKIRLVLEAS